MRMKLRFYVLWSIWTLSGALLIYVAMISDPDNTPVSVFGSVVSLSPLLGLMLTLGSPGASHFFNDWLLANKKSPYYIAGAISFLYALPGMLTGNFDPYLTVIFVFIVLVVFKVLYGAGAKAFRLGWRDAAIWILLWIPFDLRWYPNMQAGLDYTWWAIALSVIAVIGWQGYRRADIGYNLVPKLKDLIIAIVSLVMIMAIVTPPGLATGFLTFAIPGSYDVPKLAAHFTGLFLTVALLEELFFRGILLRGLENVFSKKWLPLAISSLAFGLMHWNNVDALSTKIIYVSLATIAGFGYGWAYRRSGNNLLAAIVVHTLVDWIWKLFLTG